MDGRLKRAYEPVAPSDGYRVMIDRLWPWRVSRDRVRLDEWELCRHPHIWGPIWGWKGGDA
jgi:uncharacterized protein YeaO (DUF488 family)